MLTLALIQQVWCDNFQAFFSAATQHNPGRSFLFEPITCDIGWNSKMIDMIGDPMFSGVRVHITVDQPTISLYQQSPCFSHRHL